MHSSRCGALSEAGVSSLGMGSRQVYLYTCWDHAGRGRGPLPGLAGLLSCPWQAGQPAEGGESEVRGLGWSLGWGWGSVGLCSLGRSGEVAGCLGETSPLPPWPLRCRSSPSGNRSAHQPCSRWLHLSSWVGPPEGPCQEPPTHDQLTDMLPEQPLPLAPTPASSVWLPTPNLGFCCPRPSLPTYSLWGPGGSSLLWVQRVG